MTATTELILAACPAWCTLIEGHAYELHTDPTAEDCTRYHIGGAADAMIEVSQEETVTSGVTTLGALELNLWAPDGTGVPVTPEQARALAAQIPAVVALYERLTDAGA